MKINRKIIQAKVVQRRPKVYKPTVKKGIVYTDPKYIGCPVTVIIHTKNTNSNPL